MALLKGQRKRRSFRDGAKVLLIAPKGRFRIVGIDPFNGEKWSEGNFKTLRFAKLHIAKSKSGGNLANMFVYNDKGVCVYEN